MFLNWSDFSYIYLCLFFFQISTQDSSEQADDNEAAFLCETFTISKQQWAPKAWWGIHNPHIWSFTSLTFVFFSYKFIEGVSTIEETDYKFNFNIKVTQPDRIFFDPIIYCPGIALSVRLVTRFILHLQKLASLLEYFSTLLNFL